MQINLPPHLVVREQELTGVTIQSPAGPIRGYQLRYLVESPAGDKLWSPWYFLTEPALEDLVRTTDHYMRSEGHLAAGAPPGASVQ